MIFSGAKNKQMEVGRMECVRKRNWEGACDVDTPCWPISKRRVLPKMPAGSWQEWSGWQTSDTSWARCVEQKAGQDTRKEIE